MTQSRVDTWYCMGDGMKSTFVRLVRVVNLGDSCKAKNGGESC
jgi:hypothetical protein